LEFGFLASIAVPLLHLQLGTLFQHLSDTHTTGELSNWRPGERGGARGGGGTDWGGSVSKKKKNK